MDDDTIGSASLSKLSRLSTAIKDGTVSPTLAKKLVILNHNHYFTINHDFINLSKSDTPFKPIHD